MSAAFTGGGGSAKPGGRRPFNFKEFETFKTLWRYHMIDMPDACAPDTPSARALWVRKMKDVMLVSLGDPRSRYINSQMQG